MLEAIEKPAPADKPKLSQKGEHLKEILSQATSWTLNQIDGPAVYKTPISGDYFPESLYREVMANMGLERYDIRDEEAYGEQPRRGRMRTHRMLAVPTLDLEVAREKVQAEKAEAKRKAAAEAATKRQTATPVGEISRNNRGGGTWR